VIVTAASSQNYDQLKRFLDSVTRYEPKMHTVVFDLGLSNQELSELSQHKQVTVRSFKFLVDPSWRHLSHYLKQLENNAWRPLVIQVSSNQYL
jgi:ribosome biogenesis protein Tsr3